MKRTKKQKIKANNRHVNSQLAYKFEGTYNSSSKMESAETTEKYKYLGSIKKELYKSLFVAFLILIALAVVYWFS